MTTDVATPSLAERVELVAVQGALLDKMKTVHAAERAALETDLLTAHQSLGMKSVDAKVAGVKVGRITVTETGDAFTVSDDKAYTDWVVDAHPTEVEPVLVVNPIFTKALLARLVPGDDGEAIDKTTGEVVPGIRFTRGGQVTGKFSLRYDTAPKDQPDDGGRDKALRAFSHRLPELLAGGN